MIESDTPINDQWASGYVDDRHKLRSVQQVMTTMVVEIWEKLKEKKKMFYRFIRNN